MGVALYQLQGAFMQALRLEVEGPEDMDAMIALIDEAINDIENKCINIGYVIRTLDYEAGVLKDEEKRLAERRKVRENKVDRLKSYAFGAMKKAGLDKAETVDLKVSIAKNPPSLKILDEKAVPDEYWVAHEPTIDKVSLKSFVRDHPECDYAWLESGESLRIK